MRTTVAPPDIPACRAIQPACRPITSTTRARWWLSPGVCSRSMASEATPPAGAGAGGVQPVDGLRGHAHGGVEPERVVGGVEVVVDGLGDADAADADLG